MKQGIITKGIGGFYYVACEGNLTYACRARGIFRKDQQKPLVGDLVRIDVLDETDMEGSIQEILPRKNTLFRPEVANIDQAAVVFALREPDLSRILLDRFLLSMEVNNVPVIICFSKEDIAPAEDIAVLKKDYAACGYPVCFFSTVARTGLENISRFLSGKVTALAGPSGVGKSSLLNYFCPGAEMETGQLSAKIKRGKNTTRHTELFQMDEHTWLFDTPGFGSFENRKMEKEDLELYFPEFKPFLGKCRFPCCSHGKEPSCAVTKAVDEGLISKARYESFRVFYTELAAMKRY